MYRNFCKNCSRFVFLAFAIFISLLTHSCGGGGGGDSITPGVIGPMVSGDPLLFRGAGVIGDPMYLIGGPLAQGRVGDVLLQNDKIRVIIQKPRRNAGVSLYGGNIIDGDILRPAGQPGQDNFGITFPLINVSWTPYYQRLEVLNADFGSGPVVLRATGVLNVYDYIQTSIIVPFAKIAQGVDLFFPDQYNDILNPFQNIPKLRKVSTTIVTDYILRPDRNYVIIQTHFQNSGTEGVKMPIGDWVNGSGNLESFIPGVGFTGQGLYSGNLPAGAPAMIHPGMDTTTQVSYGFFFDPTLFTNADGTIRGTDLLTVSGVTILAPGERVAPGIIPLGSSTPPTINFELPPGETVLIRYFSVGNGDVGSVLSGGLQGLGISTYPLAGRVVDANGQPVARARVLVFDFPTKKPVAMFYSDAQGNFSGDVSTGADNKAKMFGSGQYNIEVYKEGYLDTGATWPTGSNAPHASLAGKNKAGRCTIAGGLTNIQCTLGQSGLVSVTARDENGNFVPARVAVIGFDPSPYHKLNHTDDPNDQRDSFSVLSDIEFNQQMYGYMDTFFLNPSGVIATTGSSRYVNGNTFRLEPGQYEIVLMRGSEYSMHAQRITVTPGGTATVNGTLRKVVNSSGFVTGDFHIHGINSPDSPFGQVARVNFALAEGLDVMVSADHDVNTDYSRAISELGVGNFVSSIVGNEITPMAFGHFLAFPLVFNPEDPMGGAFDYTKKDGFEPGPSHHELLSPGETLEGLDQANAGEQVLQVNHIMDNLLGNFSLARLVTTTKFDGVPPMSTFSDPVQFRLSPNTNGSGGYQAPFPFGSNPMITDKFTALELCIGEAAGLTQSNLFNTAIPMWFDFLNLGKKAAATCSSDTHRQVREPMGLLKNFVQSSVDPRDGNGSFNQINPEEIARNVNQLKLVVSGGPFVRVSATGASSGQTAGLGDTLTFSGGGAQTVNLQVHVESPDWMDWDTVEIHVNTDPTPAEDDLSGPWQGTAEDFVTIAPPHLDPKYIYTPANTFKRGGGGGAEVLPQTVVAGGVRSATFTKSLNITEDSWIVVIVKSSSTAHSIFPYAPKGANTTAPDVSPETFLDTLDAQRASEGSPDKIGGTKAFAFTNPIFVDIDGNGWQAKYVRQGVSPLASP